MASARTWMQLDDPSTTSGNGRAADAAAARDPRFLRLKRGLHEQLITRLDLSAIGTISEEELRLEVRHAARGDLVTVLELLSFSNKSLSQ